ncbi:MAG: methyltransferase family protein, partial [Dolichospermum sp.]
MQTDIIATALGISSNSLIAYTIGTHRVPLHLWHQDNDKSDHIVTYGPYQKIRHPFYTSFILTLIGTFVFFPHIISLLMSVYGIVGLIVTAHREERNLQKQDTYYREYMKKTGRFMPKYF